MTTAAQNRTITTTGDSLPPEGTSAATLPPTPSGKAALEAPSLARSVVQALSKKATAPATLRAYKADWTHFSQWCAAHNFTPVPAVVGAYLARRGTAFALGEAVGASGLPSRHSLFRR